MKRDYAKTMDARMFDFPGFYTRIAEQLPEDAKIVEVGVSVGTSAIFLAEALYNLGKRFKLWMVDSLAYGGPDQLTQILEHVRAAGMADYVEILALDSLNASCRFPDQNFDFVFIDSGHTFELTKAEVRLWYRKVKEDGILAGHDYHQDQVKSAVEIVLPKLVIREPIPAKQYEAEPVLRIENTDKGYGVWWVQSKFYVRIN